MPRYMIVRHPHARLLSGYLGKVLRKPTPAIWPSGYKASSGFAGFVLAVTSARVLDGHFTLMAHHCGISTGMSYRVLRGEVRLRGRSPRRATVSSGSWGMYVLVRALRLQNRRLGADAPVARVHEFVHRFVVESFSARSVQKRPSTLEVSARRPRLLALRTESIQLYYYGITGVLRVSILE